MLTVPLIGKIVPGFVDTARSFLSLGRDDSLSGVPSPTRPPGTTRIRVETSTLKTWMKFSGPGPEKWAYQLTTSAFFNN